MHKHRFVTPFAVLSAAFATLVLAQEKVPSPPATAEVTLAGQQIKIDYSRPSMRGRKIMGDLVPYGQVWRTGANEATTLTTPVNLDIGGTNIPAGKYTLWTLPSEGTWKLIVNKQTGQWGTNYDQSQDLARIDMQKGKTSQTVEQFTISWDKKGDNAANLVLEWENTRVWVSVKAQ